MIHEEPDWDVDDEDDEEVFGNGADEEDDEATETRPCRSCGADVYEDAPQCPVCGAYPSARGGEGQRWVMAVALLAAAALILGPCVV